MNSEGSDVLRVSAKERSNIPEEIVNKYSNLREGEYSQVAGKETDLVSPKEKLERKLIGKK